MKYVQPYGIADENAGYINGNPATGTQGSIPPADVFEHPQREIIKVFETAEVTPDRDNITQLNESILRIVQRSAPGYAVDIGVANSIIVMLDPIPLQLYAGMPVRVKIAAENTGPSSLTVNSFPSVQIVHGDGSSLEAGELRAGMIALLAYDGTYFQMVNVGFSGTGGGGGGSPDYYAEDSSLTPNHIIAAFTPTVPSLYAGLSLLVKVANNVTGPTTITVETFSDKDVVTQDLQPMLLGGLVAGQIVQLVYDGIRFQATALGAQYLTKAAALNLPIYPMIGTFNNTMSCVSGVGQVIISDSQLFFHRGVFKYSTSDYPAAARTFATASNKTYHLRWRWNLGAPNFALRDLSDGTYNPGGSVETSAGFDTTYDDMLIARVVTDTNNNPAVTGLINKHRLESVTLFNVQPLTNSNQDDTNGTFVASYSWSRTPSVLSSLNMAWNNTKMTAEPDGDLILQYNVNPTRYGFTGFVNRDYSEIIRVVTHMWS